MGNYAMPGGIWITLILPAIVAFLFALWVTFSIVSDVSNRGQVVLQNKGQGALSGIVPGFGLSESTLSPKTGKL